MHWLDCNHLLLNEAKTDAIVFRSDAVHSPSPLSTIYVCGSSISLMPTVRDIGVLPDSRLDMSRIECLSRFCAAGQAQ